MSTPVRLAQRVADLAGIPRGDAELHIQNGWVRVDGVVVEAPNHAVTTEHVELDPDARLEPATPATVLLHKPAGVEILDADHARQLVTPASHWPDDASGMRVLQRHFLRLTPLVALETGASGLVVLTQDGRVWRRLTEDAHLIEHEYVVDVRGTPVPDALRRLDEGIIVRGRTLPPCKASWQSEARLRIAIKGSRPGDIAAMCAQVGLQAVAIRRLRIGRVAIGKGPEGAMPAGAWRYLPAGEKF